MNAVKYAFRDGEIDISLVAQDDLLRLEVADHGSGFAADARAGRGQG